MSQERLSRQRIRVGVFIFLSEMWGEGSAPSDYELWYAQRFREFQNGGEGIFLQDDIQFEKLCCLSIHTRVKRWRHSYDEL